MSAKCFVFNRRTLRTLSAGNLGVRTVADTCPRESEDALIHKGLTLSGHVRGQVVISVRRHCGGHTLSLKRVSVRCPSAKEERENNMNTRKSNAADDLETHCGGSRGGSRCAWTWPRSMGEPSGRNGCRNPYASRRLLVSATTATTAVKSSSNDPGSGTGIKTKSMSPASPP